MALKDSKKKNGRKYVLRDKDGIFVAYREFFDTIETREQALSMGVMCFATIHDTLQEDAVEGDDTYVGNMKLTTGLERSLEELERRFPLLLDEIHSLDIRNHGKRIYKC
jgi:hypothetical protein